MLSPDDFFLFYSQCDFHDLSFFRKEVKEMLKIAKKKQDEIQKVKVKPNHGLGFDPFPL